MLSLLMVVVLGCQEAPPRLVDRIELVTTRASQGNPRCVAEVERTVPATRLDVWVSDAHHLKVTNLETGRSFEGKGEPPYLLLTFETPAPIRVTLESEEPAKVTLHLTARAPSEATLEKVTAANASADEVQRLIGAEDYRNAPTVLASATEQLLQPPVELTEELQLACGRLAELAKTLGSHAANIRLRRVQLEFFEERVPEDHLALAAARNNYASALSASGDYAAARVIEEALVASLERTLPADDQRLLMSRGNFAITLRELGFVERACEIEKRNVEALSDRDPSDRIRQIVQLNYSISLSEAGRLQESRAIQEALLEIWEKTLPPTHPNLLGLRQNLSVNLRELGELEAARAILEVNLERMQASYPSDHPSIALLRDSLATIAIRQGAWEEGLRMYREDVLPVYESQLGPRSEQALRAKGNMLIALEALQHNEEALALSLEILSEFEALWPDFHPDVVRSRLATGILLARSEQYARAEEVLGGVLETTRAIDVTSDISLCDAWLAQMLVMDSSGRTAESAQLALELSRWLQARLEGAFALGSTPREMASLAKQIERPLIELVRQSLEQPPGSDLRHEVFRLCETLRSGRHLAARALRARDDTEAEERLRGLQSEVLQARAALGVLATQSSSADDRLVAAIRRREVAERELRRWLVGRSTPTEPALLTARALAERLAPGDLLVSTWRIARHEPFRPSPPSDEGHRLFAWVLHPSGALDMVPLGPLAPILRLAEQWRSTDILAPRGVVGRRTSGTGKGDAGASLREALLGPLSLDWERTERLHWLPAGAIAAVPIDALPLNDGVVGDVARILVHASAGELTAPPGARNGAPSLLVAGAIDYGASHKSAAPAGGSRSSPGFTPLPATEGEVQSVARSFEAAFESTGVVLTGEEATLESFTRQARGKRFIHLATHGDFEEAGQSPLTELIPSSRCGLVFAGANLGQGVLTGEELMALDLGSCELIVLSACETGLGIEQGGQGLASLQSAVLAAGARSAITSLWPVPDEVTRELMTELYRQLWLEGRSKSEALWIAKDKIRREQDDSGQPRHALQDWAGWVLTGSPD
ncbi:MAG: CHAT domain-containing tetratricopeptide repeat protein [Planctomycetota bacterium]